MQTAGYFIGSVVFMALESEKFCNSYLRSTDAVGGIITLAGFYMKVMNWFKSIKFILNKKIVFSCKTSNFIFLL